MSPYLSGGYPAIGVSDLDEALTPHLWITNVDWYAGIDPRVPPKALRISGIVKIIVPLRVTAIEVRAAGIASAETAISAVEATGWRHEDHPKITIGGEVHVTPAVHNLGSPQCVIPESRRLVAEVTLDLHLLPPDPDVQRLAETAL